MVNSKTFCAICYFEAVLSLQEKYKIIETRKMYALRVQYIKFVLPKHGVF